MLFPFRIFLLCFISAQLSAQAPAAKPLVIAHRGASGAAPENTLAAIDKALEAGADVIEIDVHQTRDSIIIVLHDEKLDRTTDKSGLIKNFNWNEINDADAGSWFSNEYAGEKIPTLADVLTHIRGRALLLIEIKKGGDYYPGIERSVFNMIQAHGAAPWCMIQSFSTVAVNNFMALNTTIPVYKLVVGNVPALPFHHDGHMRWGGILKYKQVNGVNPYRKFARKRIIRKLHERGQQIFAWTVNDEKLMRKLIARGVDGIITNYPAKLKGILAQ